MRTTVDIDPDLLDRVRAESTRSGRSFREELNRVIHRGLASTAPRMFEPYLTPTFDLGPVRAGLDLDKASSLADALADDETARKLALRK